MARSSCEKCNSIWRQSCARDVETAGGGECAAWHRRVWRPSRHRYAADAAAASGVARHGTLGHVEFDARKILQPFLLVLIGLSRILKH